MSDNFERGVELVRPYIHVDGETPKAVDDELDSGIALLEACSDEMWEANWLLGKAYEAKGEYIESVKQFGYAFQLEPNRASVVHELLVSLLRVDENKKALQIATHYASSNEPILVFDLALIESTFPDRRNSALEVLNSFDWPSDFKSRVAALREKLLESNSAVKTEPPA